MTPGFKFFGIVVLALILSVAFVNGARANEETDGCAVVMAPEVRTVYDQLEAGVHPAVVRYFVRTDGRFNDQGRWFLVTFINAWEVAAAAGLHHPRSEAIDIAMSLCRVQPPGQVQAPASFDGPVRPIMGVEI